MNVYIVLMNDRFGNKEGDRLVRKAKGFYWNKDQDKTVNVDKSNVVSLVPVKQFERLK